jgi:thioredoxin reductase
MIDVAIIGAGPYALSLASHLRQNAVEFRIFGKTMEPWMNNMPPGMLLKSYPWASCLYDPDSHFTLERFCIESGIDYHDSQMPLPLETFVAYGKFFQQHLVPEVEPDLLAELTKVKNGFRATFQDGKAVDARSVVIAVGIHPFRYTPDTLNNLSSEFLSHSGDYGPLDGFAGKHVTIVGSGASASDLAALLLERGVAVSLVARAHRLNFAVPPTGRRALWLRRLSYPLRPLVYPISGIGAGWLLKIYADAPGLFHALPERWRLDAVRTTLGPLGHAAMKSRLVGQIEVLLGRELVSAEAKRERVHLRFAAHGGAEEIRQTDHLIAATGYKIDLRNLAFLTPSLLSGIRMVENTPILSADYETSVPGLHFVGPASANSFGPVARFVFGAIHPAQRLARYLSRSRYPRSTSLGAACATST